MNQGIRQLKVENFRNLAEIDLRVADGTRVVALVGANGAGKTSILEALSQLGGGRGLLGADVRGQCGPAGKGWTVWAETADGTPLAVGFDGTGRSARLDHRPATSAQLAAVLPVIWLAPRLDRLFYEGPGDRRAWLDEQAAVLTPGHAALVQLYTQHKKARLQLLRDGRGGDWLEAEERLLAEAGIALLRGRLGYLAAMNAVAEGVSLALEGGALAVLHDDNPVAALQGKFARSREIDARLERTHAGPDTLDVAGTVSADTGLVALPRASSGQHKRALLRLVLAQARLVAAKGLAPVVVLDELGAHLDAAAKRAALADLEALGAQVWLSDTEMAESLPTVQVVRVEEGALRAAVDSLPA